MMSIGIMPMRFPADCMVCGMKVEEGEKALKCVIGHGRTFYICVECSVVFNPFLIKDMLDKPGKMMLMTNKEKVGI